MPKGCEHVVLLLAAAFVASILLLTEAIIAHDYAGNERTGTSRTNRR